MPPFWLYDQTSPTLSKMATVKMLSCITIVSSHWLLCLVLTVSPTTSSGSTMTIIPASSSSSSMSSSVYKTPDSPHPSSSSSSSSSSPFSSSSSLHTISRVKPSSRPFLFQLPRHLTTISPPKKLFTSLPSSSSYLSPQVFQYSVISPPPVSSFSSSNSSAAPVVSSKVVPVPTSPLSNAITNAMSTISTTKTVHMNIPSLMEHSSKKVEKEDNNDTITISTSTTIHQHNNNENKSNWWVLGTKKNYAKHLEITPATYKVACGKVHFLTNLQREICAMHHNVINAIGRGARLSIEECQYQFKMNRWNCSTYEGAGERVFGPVLDINSREKAFIHAITTAGVVQSITRACSRGEISQCGCDDKIRSKDTQDKWEWGGCSDDIHYGAEFTKKFIDSVEDANTTEGMVNLHNNEVGRRVIKSKMELICKCHGVSGTCTIKVCWRKMKPFREVGLELSARFDGATHVKVIESRKKRSRLRPAQKNVKKPSKKDLVYLEESPDFCFQNFTIGAMGTRERICNATSYGLDGCRYLCCGRGYRTIEREVEQKCNCKFVWCCNVKCDKCRSRVIEHRCN